MIAGKNTAGLIRQGNFLNTTLVYILIFCSGSLRYLQSEDRNLVVGFVVVLAIWFVYSDRKISESFILYCFTFAGILFALSLYTGGSLSLPSIGSVSMKLILAYLVIRTVGEKFAETYVSVIVFFAVVSLFGYLSDTLHLFDGLVQKLPNIPGRGYEGFFYVFRDTYHPYRNQSIFFEPGAYQAFLNAALFIIFFSKTRLDARRQWLYIIILMAALTTTFSTTGFIIFLCGFFLFLYKSEVATFYGKLVLVSIGIIIIIFFAAQFNESFVKKINDYMTANEYEFTYSAQTRSSQLKADLRVIKKHVFGLGQREYLREFQMEGRTENRGSSNGVTKILAMYGIPIGIFIFGSYYWALRRILNKPLLVAGAFVMFMLFLAGEAYYVTAPVSYAIIAAAFVIKHKSIYEKSAEEVV
jgi:hypothetical protein